MSRTPGELDLVIGENIRSQRLKLGLSQAALGQAIGVSFQQIQKYEAGRNRLAVSLFLEICRVLDIKPEWLWKE